MSSGWDGGHINIGIGEIVDKDGYRFIDGLHDYTYTLHSTPSTLHGTVIYDDCDKKKIITTMQYSQDYGLQYNHII
jgi:hypothetical protein